MKGNTMFKIVKTVANANAKHAVEHPIAHTTIAVAYGIGVKMAVYVAVRKMVRIKLEQEAYLPKGI